MSWPQPWCFRTGNGDLSLPVPDVRLPSRKAQAVANLIPILGCGEESASFAFERIAQECVADIPGSAALAMIGQEEAAHEAILRALSAALPPAIGFAERKKAARNFHLRLGRGSVAERLACIAATDAAVCLVLGRLVRPGTGLAEDVQTAASLRRIRDDEARHVGISRKLAIARGDIGLTAVAAEARKALSAVLTLAADDFEALEFDPQWLDAHVAPLPSRLFDR